MHWIQAGAFFYGHYLGALRKQFSLPKKCPGKCAMSAVWPNSNYSTLRMSPCTTQDHPFPQAQYLQPCEHMSPPPWADHQIGPSLLLQKETVENDRSTEGTNLAAQSQ